MQAITVSKFGGPEVMQVTDAELQIGRAHV